MGSGDNLDLQQEAWYPLSRKSYLMEVIKMVIKISSKHQVTIPKDIAEVFHLRKGDVLEVQRQGNKIVMIPKEMILEDKYSKEDLEAAEKILSKGLPKEEMVFESGTEMTNFLKKRIEK